LRRLIQVSEFEHEVRHDDQRPGHGVRPRSALLFIPIATGAPWWRARRRGARMG